MHASQPKKDFSNTEPKQVEYFGLKQNGNKIMKTEGSQHKPAALDHSIIPLLVADTFFDKLLGRSADGIDLVALNTVKEAQEHNKAKEDNLSIIIFNETNDAGGAASSDVSTLNNKDLIHAGQSSSGFKYNFPMAAPAQSRAWFNHGFVAKLRFMLPPNKTIFDVNIDDFEEKLWRNPAVEISDFFNYGLDEKQWKDYCTVMQSQIQAPSSGKGITTADKCRPWQKVHAAGEVNMYRRMDECLPLINSKDSSFNDSDVIVQIVPKDSFNQNDSRKKYIKHDRALANTQGANPLVDGGNTKHTIFRMINGDTILPFPMDGYPIRPSEYSYA